MKAILLCFALMIGSAAIAQDKPEIKEERVFAGKALYGFMNGGSDLYYEYGFEQLITREVKYMDEEFTVDIYQMENPEMAFGIYSILTYKCGRADVSGGFDCQSKYQLQTVSGNKYISLVFHSGSEKAKEAADKLLRIYAPETDNDLINIPQQLSFLPKPVSGTVKLLKGILAVNNKYPEFSALINGMKNYSVWLAEKEGCALFILSNEEDCTLVKNKIPASKIRETGKMFVLMNIE